MVSEEWWWEQWNQWKSVRSMGKCIVICLLYIIRICYEATRPICFLYSVICMLGKIYIIASTNNKTCSHLCVCIRHVQSTKVFLLSKHLCLSLIVVHFTLLRHHSSDSRNHTNCYWEDDYKISNVGPSCNVIILLLCFYIEYLLVIY